MLRYFSGVSDPRKVREFQYVVSVGPHLFFIIDLICDLFDFDVDGNLHSDQRFRTTAEVKGEGLDQVKHV